MPDAVCVRVPDPVAVIVCVIVTDEVWLAVLDAVPVSVPVPV